MTRKDYVLIAAALKAARDEIPVGGAGAEYLANSVAARHIANALASDNARFDRARFLAACGVQS
jgi:hypothetical protein